MAVSCLFSYTVKMFVKSHLSKAYRARAVTFMAIMLGALHYGNLLREAHYHSLLGHFPSFAATAAAVLLLPSINQLPTGEWVRRGISLVVVGTVWHAAYEFVLYLDGRPYDWWDNLSAVLGAIFGWLVVEILFRGVLPVTE